MTCALCDQAVDGYRPELHLLVIDDDRSVAICDACTDKFARWHGERLARLFPTKRMKKLRGRQGRS